ncbi:MAG: co-chaperone GroES [bacterium]|nr:co-chaperone GroES [bacterium]
MKLRPLANRVVVKPVKETTKGGIILPETASKEKPEKGEVIATGPGRLLDSGQRAPMEVKVGDTVVFKKYSPDEFKMEEQEYLILEDTDVMAVLE